MKKIEAIIRPERFEEVKMHLEIHGFIGMTVSDVKGRGCQGGVSRQWRGREYWVDLLPKIKLCLVVPDTKADEAVEAIIESSRTGEIGDGKIFITPIEKIITVRTGLVEE